MNCTCKPLNDDFIEKDPNCPEHGKKPLTKREQFAMFAMQGFIVSNAYASPSYKSSTETIAKRSVWMADALIKALNQTNDD